MSKQRAPLRPEEAPDPRQAEQALHESRERFKALIANVPGIAYRCACDEQRTMEFISDAVETISGYSASDFVDNAVRSYASIIHPDDGRMVEEAVREAVRNKEPYTTAYRIVNADGSIRWVCDHGRGSYDGDGTPKWLDGVAVDITEQRRAEQAIARFKEEWERTFDAAPSLFGIIDGQFRIVRANKAMADGLGLTPQECIGKTCYRAVHGTDEPPSFCPLRQTMEDGLRHDVEIYEAGLGGYYRISTSPLTDELGRVIGGVHVAHDITDRKKAQEAVLKGETRYRQLVEGLSEGIAALDTEGIIVFANPAFAEIIGDSIEELIGSDFFGSTNEYQRESFRRSLLDQSRRATDTLEAKLLRRDGRLMYLSMRGSPIIDDEGNHVGSLVVINDISERRQAEEALKESERRYRAIFEGASEGILIADAETTELIHANPTICSILGYSPQELLSKKVADIHPPEHFAMVMSQFRAQVEGRLRLAPDIPCLRKDGTIIWADVNAAGMSLDGRNCLVSFFSDITERTKAEHAVRESEARYRQLVESLSEGIAAMDKDGIITFVNPAFTRIVGDRVETLIGSDFFGSMNRFQREAFRRSFLQQRRGPGHVYQMQFLRRDGQWRYLSLQGSPIIDDAGNHIGMLAVINDVTQQRQAEESLKTAHRKLMYAGEQERRALARDLHDSLGQQAVAIHLAIEGLLTDARRIGDSSADSLARLSHLCQSLTEDIRTTCRGLFPPILEALGLCAALRQLVRDYENIIHVTIDYSRFPESLRLASDIEIALFRIAQEAITNVLRHSKAKHLTLSMVLENDQMTLTVSDDGIDFDVEQAKATGLGLLTMRERANAVGGMLEVESQPGRTSIIARVPVTGRDNVY